MQYETVFILRVTDKRCYICFLSLKVNDSGVRKLGSISGSEDSASESAFVNILLIFYLEGAL